MTICDLKALHPRHAAHRGRDTKALHPLNSAHRGRDTWPCQGRAHCKAISHPIAVDHVVSEQAARASCQHSEDTCGLWEAARGAVDAVAEGANKESRGCRQAKKANGREGRVGMHACVRGRERLADGGRATDCVLQSRGLELHAQGKAAYPHRQSSRPLGQHN